MTIDDMTEKMWYEVWYYIATADMESKDVDMFKKYYNEWFMKPCTMPINEEFIEGWDVGYSDSYDIMDSMVPKEKTLYRSNDYIGGYRAGYMFHCFMNYLYK
jgi:hypothetical protein